MSTQQQQQPTVQDLVDVSNTLFTYQKNAASIVEEQGQLLNLLDQENQYLMEKQSAISNEQSKNGRTVSFNQNFSNRFIDYIKMVVILAVGLGILMIIITLQRMNTISNTLATILSIASVSICIIILFTFYVKLISRDNMDYNKIKTTPPPDSIFGTSGSSDSTNGLNTVCVGQACCTPTMFYNTDLNMCEMITKNTHQEHFSNQEIQDTISKLVPKKTEPFSTFVGPSYTNLS
jgi:hypothetical protein